MIWQDKYFTHLYFASKLSLTEWFKTKIMLYVNHCNCVSELNTVYSKSEQIESTSTCSKISTWNPLTQGFISAVTKPTCRSLRFIGIWLLQTNRSWEKNRKYFKHFICCFNTAVLMKTAQETWSVFFQRRTIIKCNQDFGCISTFFSWTRKENLSDKWMSEGW